ncbi:hydroxyethylthiazole kinase [Nonlabens tegetincola]|uniref:hydroxyethylthiazole kinase n=1 Tax=Nonlabens tegetincola TaxID=323273 RepID=UPI000CF43E0C|nr:hydroxyethylthiazole kinase [Nonlabens tegetincola]PQJ13999.1 hydroxyethylthiazole kinase [Nonlabens tegetincola]
MNTTIDLIKTQSPLIHNITNYVVMNNTANALLAIGASPVMAHAIEEVEDITMISSSLVINMGTLSKSWVAAMEQAMKKAKANGIPIVFDPVGVGASNYRTQTALHLAETYQPDVIRGNASEIMALAQLSSNTKGVDSTIDSNNAVDAASTLSRKLNNTIVISGATDYIVTGDKIEEITGGSAMMPKITGMGCTATSIIGACVAVNKDIHKGARDGMEIMSKAGEQAESKSNGPGSFQMNFIDALFQLT